MDFDALSADELAELHMIERVQRGARARRAARVRLIRRDAAHGGLHIQAIVHVGEVGIEDRLRTEIESVTDVLLLARHRSEPSRGTQMDELLARQLTLQSAMRSVRRVIDVRLGHVPARGPDWSAAGAPELVRRAATELSSKLARAAIALIDAVLDSELFDLADAGGTEPVQHLRRADAGDHDAAARAVAFCDELQRLQDMHDATIARLRLEARRAEHREMTSSIEPQRDRRVRAERTLDGLRALHAAIAELEASYHRAS